MENKPNDPGKESKRLPKIIWLFCAFVPSAATIASFKIKHQEGGLLVLLIILNVICSFISAYKLGYGMKSRRSQIGLGFLLGLAFFVLNVFIAVYAGCSGMGKIAP